MIWRHTERRQLCEDRQISDGATGRGVPRIASLTHHSANTLFPNKVIVTGIRDWDLNILFLGETIQPTTLPTVPIL